jgi:hypothetical protein
MLAGGDGLPLVPAGHIGVGAPQLLHGGREAMVLGMPAQLHADGRDGAGTELGPVDDALPGERLTEQVVSEGRARQQRAAQDRVQ